MVVTSKTALDTLEQLLENNQKRGMDARSYCLKTLEIMLRSRFADHKMMKLVRQNKGGTFHLSVLGHELIGAVSALALHPEKDWGLPYYRDRTFALGLGCDLKEIIGAFLTRDVPHHSGGRMMPEHFSHKRLRIPCQSSVVGSQLLHAVGLAKAIQLEKKDEVVYVSCGEGATSQGDFHEALNFSVLHKLSVIFVVQDNDWAISVPRSEQTAGGSIARNMKGYSGLQIFEFDGCDYEQTSKALASAVRRGRKKEGPSLVVAKVPRIGPHSISDDPKKYKNEEMLLEDQQRDPLPRFKQWLLDMGLVTAEELEALEAKIFEEVEQAAKEAEQIPFPDPKHVKEHLFLDSKFQEKELEVQETEPVVIVDALNHGLHEAMEEEAGVILFGQDVAHGKGGVFGVSRGLTEKFGRDRCFNTPLAESTIVGIATGISMYGNLKPIAEVQFADYLWTGINQLFNELASIHYRSNGEWNCPVVLRMPYGGYIQGGPYHSQSIEAFLCHCPGLKVVIPSNAADAKRLLKAAIADPNPVVFLEHKALYRQRMFCAKPEPLKEEKTLLGKANKVREGEDITVIGYGMMIPMVDEIATRLKEEGITVDLIDLRTLNPLDFEMIRKSVGKTGKALVVHEAPRNCGFGAELAARISEELFAYLDAPVQRVGGLDVPVSYCKILEDATLPQKATLEQAIRSLHNY